jgi:hypothetical protein
MTIGDTQFNFKNIYPRYDVTFCRSCSYKFMCTEWIIPPRFYAESGIFCGCLLNPAKRVFLYDDAGESRGAQLSAVRELLTSAWLSLGEKVSEQSSVDHRR